MIGKEGNVFANGRKNVRLGFKKKNEKSDRTQGASKRWNGEQKVLMLLKNHNTKGEGGFKKEGQKRSTTWKQAEGGKFRQAD